MAIQSNRKYLAKTLSRFSLAKDDIGLILAEHPGSEEVNFNVSMCKNAIYKSASEILPVANTSEGGFSLPRNMNVLKTWYNTLCKKLGKESILGDKPKVRNHSNS